MKILQKYARYVAIWLPSYGVKKDSPNKNSQREVTQKVSPIFSEK